MIHYNVTSPPTHTTDSVSQQPPQQPPLHVPALPCTSQIPVTWHLTVRTCCSSPALFRLFLFFSVFVKHCLCILSLPSLYSVSDFLFYFVFYPCSPVHFWSSLPWTFLFAIVLTLLLPDSVCGLCFGLVCSYLSIKYLLWHPALSVFMMYDTTFRCLILFWICTVLCKSLVNKLYMFFNDLFNQRNILHVTVYGPLRFIIFFF